MSAALVGFFGTTMNTQPLPDARLSHCRNSNFINVHSRSNKALTVFRASLIHFVMPNSIKRVHTCSTPNIATNPTQIQHVWREQLRGRNVITYQEGDTDLSEPISVLRY